MSRGLRTNLTRLSIFLAWLVCLPALAQVPAGRPFRAGAATSNMTPPLGGDIIGGFVPYPATHVHDELYARCLVLDDGHVKLALVVCDLLGLDRLVSEEARDLIKKDTGIPPEHVLISATHTHSACSALGKDPRILQRTADEYQRFVARRIGDGVKRAANLLRPAEIAWGSAEAPEHVFNRRWFMKPGPGLVNPFGGTDQVCMNPPVGSADLVKPAGPVDPTISFLAVREPGGRPISVFAAYGLHYVGGVGPGHISADYFGMYCDALGRLLKTAEQTPPFVALLANGTSGDVNNINFRQPRPKKAAYEQMKLVADDVAQKVHAAVGKAAYHSHVTLDARYCEPAIGVRRPSPALVTWAKKILAERPRVAGKADLPAIYAERTLRMAEHPESLKLPLQTLRVGKVALATMPCEVFCEIGLDYKKRSCLQPAFMVSLNHGYFGYLPTPRQHELGGYETWLGTNRLEICASDKMLDHLLEMTAEMKAVFERK